MGVDMYVSWRRSECSAAPRQSGVMMMWSRLCRVVLKAARASAQFAPRLRPRELAARGLGCSQGYLRVHMPCARACEFAARPPALAWACLRGQAGDVRCLGEWRPLA